MYFYTYSGLLYIKPATSLVGGLLGQNYLLGHLFFLFFGFSLRGLFGSSQALLDILTLLAGGVIFVL